MKPRLVWSPAYRNWCCTTPAFRACASTPKAAFDIWASEVALRILLSKLENHHAHPTH